MPSTSDLRYFEDAELSEFDRQDLVRYKNGRQYPVRGRYKKSSEGLSTKGWFLLGAIGLAAAGGAGYYFLTQKSAPPTADTTPITPAEAQTLCGNEKPTSESSQEPPSSGDPPQTANATEQNPPSDKADASSSPANAESPKPWKPLTFEEREAIKNLKLKRKEMRIVRIEANVQGSNTFSLNTEDMEVEKDVKYSLFLPEIYANSSLETIVLQEKTTTKFLHDRLDEIFGTIGEGQTLFLLAPRGVKFLFYTKDLDKRTEDVRLITLNNQIYNVIKTYNFEPRKHAPTWNHVCVEQERERNTKTPGFASGSHSVLRSSGRDPQSPRVSRPAGQTPPQSPNVPATQVAGKPGSPAVKPASKSGPNQNKPRQKSSEKR